MAVNLEELRKKQQEMESAANAQGGDFVNNFLQLKEGKTTVRVLPGKTEDGLFYAETKIHRLPNGEDQIKNYHCRKVNGDNCPICDAYYALWKMHNDAGFGKEKSEFSELARQIKARERYYMNVVDRESGEVKILSVGQIIFGKIVNIILNPDFGDMTDLVEGRDFIIVKRMEGGWPKYDESYARPQQTRAGTDKEVDMWMGSLHDIQGLVREEDYEDMKNAVAGLHPALNQVSKPEEQEEQAPWEGGEEDFRRKLQS